MKLLIFKCLRTNISVCINLNKVYKIIQRDDDLLQIYLSEKEFYLANHEDSKRFWNFLLDEELI